MRIGESVNMPFYHNGWQATSTIGVMGVPCGGLGVAEYPANHGDTLTAHRRAGSKPV